MPFSGDEDDMDSPSQSDLDLPVVKLNKRKDAEGEECFHCFITGYFDPEIMIPLKLTVNG